ncbi:DUF2188 domain-containing protein [Cohnella rhizosphaerae]|uniref:DUF2188 domain-containing protein n=1 Tax=Cohnella rhizosphaerae TaxID=1457232 RepID=A0A9X4QQW9_9BACL|nr:DUF2188 domain-containing protein [Cohnella rhizosphaerae]MDG0807970.1 DUF2188 domain-containing protein [Cohnella rhizosphaerae]
MPNQHVVPHEKGWAVRGEGASRPEVVTNTKQEAVEAARKLAQEQRSELVVHGKDGRIQTKDSHGHDPYPPKG